MNDVLNAYFQIFPIQIFISIIAFAIAGILVYTVFKFLIE
jgi:hypothetical protein